MAKILALYYSSWGWRSGRGPRRRNMEALTNAAAEVAVKRVPELVPKNAH
jgi:hypothetical protein